MNNQTVLKIPTPPPQQSVALAPLAGQRRKRPKLTTDQDDANHGDSTKQAIVAVLVENTDGDPGDLVVEGDRVSSPFMGGVKLAVDLNMKGATFQWQRCSDLPIKHAYNVQAVLLEKKVYFASEIEVETVPPYMYTYDIDDNLWQLLPSPARRAALAVYRGKVVLAGGMLSNNIVTNKVWVLQDDNTWSESLPPMPTARYGASATSGNNFLIVAAGMTNGSCASDMVEIYDGKQWMAMSPLPRKWWDSWSTSLNGYCFLFCQGTSVLYTSIQDDATKGSIKQLGWKKLPDTPCSTTGITTFAGTLLAVGASIHMYYPLAQQWVSLRNDLMPVKYYECIVSLSSRELMVIGKENRENCLQVYKGTLVSK